MDDITPQQYNSALDNLSDAIARYDVECRCIYVNRAYESLCSLSADRVIGRTPLESSGLPDSVARSLQALLEEVIETRQEAGSEAIWGDDGGEAQPHYLLAIPELDAAEEVRAVFVVVSDLSMERTAEMEHHQVYSRLRQLAERRSASWEEERRRLAWNLQEEMGQLMAALKVRVETVRMRLDGIDPDAMELVREMDGLVDRCIGMSKEMVDTLRPAVLNLGIKPALERLSELFSRRNGIACKLRIEDFPDLEDEELATILFRAVQVALDNISNHARADRVDVSLEESAGEYVLTITDNGAGFMPELEENSGFGLPDMQERIAMHGGKMVVFSAPDQGTVVEARFPVLAGLLPA